MDVNWDDQPKDQNVLSFMMELVQEKFGSEVDAEFLNQESTRLYNLFGNNLVGYFEPMLTPDQKQEFDLLVQQTDNQENLLNYLMQAIPNLEQQILQVLINFRLEYLQPQQPVTGAQAPQTPPAPQAPQVNI